MAFACDLRLAEHGTSSSFIVVQVDERLGSYFGVGRRFFATVDEIGRESADQRGRRNKIGKSKVWELFRCELDNILLVSVLKIVPAAAPPPLPFEVRRSRSSSAAAGSQ